MSEWKCPCCGRSELKQHLYHYSFGSSQYSDMLCRSCEDGLCECKGGDDEDDCGYLLFHKVMVGRHPNCKFKKTKFKLTAKQREQSHQNWAEIEEMVI